MMNFYIHEIITGYKFSFVKHFVETLNKLYVRNVKKILAQPIGGFHTQVSAL
jgi:hypothetical protein